ncbi:MAG: hypothetical protein Q7J35_10025 [Candidatus Methanoperedens sp.]|nr:hypothetical protein [Candidatus Methanoperedens sp.]
MSARRMWVFSPNSGGKKIPDLVRIDVEKRINDVAEQQLKGKFIRLDLSFKGQFCYIDAFTEPAVDENWNEELLQETREEHIERLRNSPLHLCRLRYFDKDKWGFAFYNYSNEKYELATYPDGEFFGKPEDAFLASAVFY